MIEQISLERRNGRHSCESRNPGKRACETPGKRACETPGKRACETPDASENLDSGSVIPDVIRDRNDVKRLLRKNHANP